MTLISDSLDFQNRFIGFEKQNKSGEENQAKVSLLNSGDISIGPAICFGAPTSKGRRDIPLIVES